MVVIFEDSSLVWNVILTFVDFMEISKGKMSE
jgi:hypothetical protein